MSTRLQCSHCDHEFSVADDRQGKRVRCPECDELTRVPSESDADGAAEDADAEEKTVPDVGSAKTAVEEIVHRKRTPPPGSGKKRRPRDEDDDDDDRPERKRTRDESDDDDLDDDDRPKKERTRDESDDDVDDDQDDDDRPKRRRTRDDESEDDLDDDELPSRGTKKMILVGASIGGVALIGIVVLATLLMGGSGGEKKQVAAIVATPTKPPEPTPNPDPAKSPEPGPQDQKKGPTMAPPPLDKQAPPKDPPAVKPPPPPDKAPPPKDPPLNTQPKLPPAKEPPMPIAKLDPPPMPNPGPMPSPGPNSSPNSNPGPKPNPGPGPGPSANPGPGPNPNSGPGPMPIPGPLPSPGPKPNPGPGPGPNTNPSPNPNPGPDPFVGPPNPGPGPGPNPNPGPGPKPNPAPPDSGKPKVIVQQQGAIQATDASDPFQPQTKQKVYPVNLVAGKRYTISLNVSPGKRFVAVVRLEAGPGNVVSVNSNMNSLEAKLDFTPPQSGSYRVVVTNFTPKQYGAFSLSVTETAGAGPSNNGPNGNSNWPVMGQGPGVIYEKEGKILELDSYDPKRIGSQFKMFPITLSAGKTYTIDVKKTAGKLDPFARLQDQVGIVLAQDDNSGGGKDARITFKAIVNANYYVVVTTAAPMQYGSFKMILTELEKTAATPAPPVKTPDVVVFKEKFDLSPEDAPNPQDTLARCKTVTVKLEKDKTYMIEMRKSIGSQVQCKVSVISDNVGTPPPQAAGPLVARITRFTPNRTDSFVIRCSNERPGQYGFFELKVTQLGN